MERNALKSVETREEQRDQKGAPKKEKKPTRE
jgi:hypothetical protein